MSIIINYYMYKLKKNKHFQILLQIVILKNGNLYWKQKYWQNTCK